MFHDAGSYYLVPRHYSPPFLAGKPVDPPWFSPSEGKKNSSICILSPEGRRGSNLIRFNSIYNILKTRAHARTHARIYAHTRAYSRQLEEGMERKDSIASPVGRARERKNSSILAFSSPEGRRGSNLNQYKYANNSIILRTRAHVRARERQQEAISSLIADRDDKILVIRCGGGKTVISLLAAVQGGRAPVLVVVHTNALADQWEARINQFLDLEPEDVGRVQAAGGLAGPKDCGSHASDSRASEVFRGILQVL